MHSPCSFHCPGLTQTVVILSYHQLGRPLSSSEKMYVQRIVSTITLFHLSAALGMMPIRGEEMSKRHRAIFY